ncbi:MAG TPA: hypothetical protein VMU04_19245 [Candidatus Acidoferrum sp.]|nr:hypothetical protein [Candidatus Acidoferrum sp.]
MRARLRIALLIGALALLAVALGLHSARSGSQGSLRRYLAGLHAKGEPLTYEELARNRVTNAFDSLPVITNAANVLKGNLEPGRLDLRRYTAAGQAEVNWQQPSPLWTTSNGTQGQGTWEEVEAQMQGAQPALQQVRAALTNPAADAGPYTVAVFTNSRIAFVAIRTVAQWLAGAAENDLHQRRLNDALQNLQALAALARMERQEPILVAQMVRVSVANLGLAATWEALQAPGWTEPQLEQLQRSWAQLDLLDAAERGFVGERVGGLQIAGMMRHSEGSHVFALLSGAPRPPRSKATTDDIVGEYLVLPVYKLFWLDRDELFYLRNMEESITAMRLLKAGRPWPEVAQRLDQITSNVNAIARSPGKFRYIFSIIVLPNYQKASQMGARAEVELQMTQAAIALKRFQLRHGCLPPSLDALVPEFLPAVPFDCMAGRPLRYHTTPDGAYVLYSVGEDGVDDGGDATLAAGMPNGMWTSRDAVWPRPAPAAGGQGRPAARRDE